MGAAERFGAQTKIRLTDLSIFNSQLMPGMIAVLKGYLDDSKSDGQAWAVGGYVGGDHHWKAFDENWPVQLAVHGVPYFHMKEMHIPDGVYAKWNPPKDHQPEWIRFLGDMGGVIEHCRLLGIASIVRLEDLDRFNRQTGLALEPYPLTLYGCMILLAKEYPGEPIQITVDRLEKASAKVAVAQKYADSDSVYAGDFDRTVVSPLPKELTFREVPAIQAADYIAWEYRKNHRNINDWFLLGDKPRDFDERWDAFNDWYMLKYGDQRSTLRKSAEPLLRNNRFTSLVWDYDQICDASRLRGGVWA
jgi:hypothetical protein